MEKIAKSFCIYCRGKLQVPNSDFHNKCHVSVLENNIVEFDGNKIYQTELDLLYSLKNDETEVDMIRIEDFRIVSLRIFCKEIIPLNLFTFKSLKYLNISSTTHIFPTELSKLNDLESLTLHLPNNASFDNIFLKFKFLKFIDLIDLNSVFLDYLFNTPLDFIYMSHSKITLEKNIELKSLQNIKVFSIDNCFINSKKVDFIEIDNETELFNFLNEFSR